MSFLSLVCNTYPAYVSLIHSIPKVPLKARSLLIKQCQAQYDIPVLIPDPVPTLIKLLDSHPPVPFATNRGTFEFCQVRHFFRQHEISVEDPIQSAIILDLLRGLPVEDHEIAAFREAGWVKEINLGWGRREASVNFRPFFFTSDDPIHPDIPHNSLNLIRIRMAFRAFRQKLIDHPPTWYPRATHKNMSRSTRRDFENVFEGASLDTIPIFGQDDWCEVYARTGVMLEGEVELRQKWYPSNPKPRTYAAMGGTSYRYCRHLQEFFTSLTNIFPSTNHITRLRPGRLYVPPLEPSSFYRVYDLSNFTSNMAEQKNFCESLAEFMDGVMVYIVDECRGIVERNLGEMLTEYNTHCVHGPMMSVERAPEHLHPAGNVFFSHGTASLLGIFGNLMTCTVAHYLIISPVTDSFSEDNTAGDDGLVLEHDYSSYVVDKCVSIVGDWEPEKCFTSREPGSICLKRPLRHIGKNLELLPNAVPPTIVSAISYLQGSEVDSRFLMPNLENLPLRDRVAVVGVDLLRFLRVCYRMGSDCNFGMVDSLFKGFVTLVRKICHIDVVSFCIASSVLWPVDPSSYDFFSVDPYEMWVSLNAGCQEVDERDYQEISWWQLKESGDAIRGNSTARLVFLEKIGYVKKERVTRLLDQNESYFYLLNSFRRKIQVPVVYQYTCLVDIPECLLFD